MAYTSRSSLAHEPCDSFFIESDLPSFAARINPRERARRMAYERQLAYADELSHIATEEYQDDILDHMEQMEMFTMPDVASMDIQTEIQWYMRPYLLDFLIESHAAFQLLPETLFLAINLLDRYCSKRVVYKRHYQLVGCAALMIAAKYGDRKDRVPTIRELKSMCCALYDDDMFMQMEWHVLQTLNWIIGHPTVDTFLQMIHAEVSEDPELEHMASYICEMASFHRDFVAVRPSVMARSVLALAACILGRPLRRRSEWASQYDSPLVIQISNKLHTASLVLAKKYSSPHLSCASSTLDSFLVEQADLLRRADSPPPAPLPVAAPAPLPPVGVEGPQTPQKGAQPAHMPHGYLTPPITPEGEHFIGMPADRPFAATEHGSPRSPSTPSPRPTPHMSFMQGNYSPPMMPQATA
ncbi:MAG: hypothetical protein M1829_001187 [Trizodia sp. TS-e1964]|nr:MAG: hypothetical protein M1829_001187 [Trizodia sp. TS-e1964]